MSATFTKSFSLELLLGVHDFSADQIKVALYDASATIDGDTAAYSSAGEISGSGYAAGGNVFPVSAGYPQVEMGRGSCRFDSAAWASPSTFTYRKALVYNASKGNRSILTIDFGIDRGPLNAGHFIDAPLSSLPTIFISRG